MRPPELLFALLIFGGCASAEAPKAAPVPAPEPPPAPRAAATPASAEPASAAAPPAKDTRPFPPPAFAPLFDRTKQPDDGAWRPVANVDPALMVQSVVHPHPIKPFVFVAVVAVDRTRTDLHLASGTLEPNASALPPELRTGLVPEAEQPALLAVANGGFMAKHGQFGMKLGGTTLVAPKPDVCAIAGYAGDELRIATFSTLAATEPKMTFYRQTPPCLVENGQTHPDLDSEYLVRKWGGSETGERDIRRSALGLSADGRTLFYGVGEWVSAKAIAIAMKRAGAENAAELDINWSYTRFLFYGRGAEGLGVTKTLIPKMAHSVHGYVKKPSERDFFYFTRRAR